MTVNTAYANCYCCFRLVQVVFRRLLENVQKRVDKRVTFANTREGDGFQERYVN